MEISRIFFYFILHSANGLQICSYLMGMRRNFPMSVSIICLSNLADEPKYYCFEADMRASSIQWACRLEVSFILLIN